jgi:hypothetical protein
VHRLVGRHVAQASKRIRKLGWRELFSFCLTPRSSGLARFDVAALVSLAQTDHLRLPNHLPQPWQPLLSAGMPACAPKPPARVCVATLLTVASVRLPPPSDVPAGPPTGQADVQQEEIEVRGRMGVRVCRWACTRLTDGNRVSVQLGPGRREL